MVTSGKLDERLDNVIRTNPSDQISLALERIGTRTGAIASVGFSFSVRVLNYHLLIGSKAQ